MKTWSTGNVHAKGDLYTDEVPIPKLTITEQFVVMRRTYRSVPRADVNDVLETLGLRKHRG